MDNMDNDINRINTELEKAEELELPESLSGQSVAELLKDKKPSRAHVRTSLKRALAIAAAFAVVCASLLIIKPWQSPPVTPQNESPNTAGNVVMPASMSYSDIEKLFVAYNEANKASFFDRFTFSYNKSADYAIAEAAPQAAADNASGFATAPTGGAVATGKGGGSSEHGQTNEQVSGVNEADIIKNDGQYLYMAIQQNSFSNYWVKYGSSDYDSMPNYNGVAVIKPEADGSMSTVSMICPEPDAGGDYEYVIQNFYVSGNTLTAIFSVWGVSQTGAYEGGNEKTAVIVFDITDRAAPVETSRYYQSGYHLSSRLIGTKLLLISNYYVGCDGTLSDNDIKKKCIPETGTVNGLCERLPESCICVMDSVSSPTYLVVTNLDITGAAQPATAAVLGGGSNVYCSADKLYVTNGEYDDSFAAAAGGVVADIGRIDTKVNTCIYSFDIAGSGIAYKANTSVEGGVLNQFSTDEYNGCLRIATTSGNGENATNAIYVLDGELKTIGELKGIAPGESIQSVRFAGDRGYVVTFLRTDPLFVIDLSSPTAPKILGELKIPGFSAYLHPITSTLMAGIGVGGNDQGQDSTLKVSLFDVSDPSSPKEADVFIYGTPDNMNVYSDAYYDHKAVCWDDANKILYFPMTVDKWLAVGGLDTHHTSIAGLKIDTAANTFKEVKEYRYDNNEYDQLNRCTYIDNLVYGFTADKVIAFDKATAAELSALDFNDYSFSDSYTPRSYVPETVPVTQEPATQEPETSGSAAEDTTLSVQTTPAFDPQQTTAAPEQPATDAPEQPATDAVQQPQTEAPAQVTGEQTTAAAIPALSQASQAAA